MMTKFYLALYKGKKTGCAPSALVARFSDWLTRKLTKGAYSHCELVIERQVEWGQYDYRPEHHCYSSSIRDGGVRCKQMILDADKWDLIDVTHLVTEQAILSYFSKTKGSRYDWWGAIGIVLGIKQKRSKYFCSEWCFNAVFGGEDGWRFSPNQLAAIVKHRLSSI